MKIFLLIFIGIILLVLPFSSAAHYIAGYVNDAMDGTLANDHIIVLWNPVIGFSDNITDIIGPNGNSGANNIYMIDCEMLNTPCKIGDNMSLQVVNNGDNYITGIVNVTVTGAGYDIMPELTLNSLPNVSLNFPLNNANISSKTVNFNCSANDLDSNLYNITLYGNWSGGWHANETKSISGNFSSVIFSKNLSDGTYQWNCLVTDNLSVSRFNNQNFSFTLDSIPPNVSSIFLNSSILRQNKVNCMNDYVRVNCSVKDDLMGVQSVKIEAIKPFGRQSYSAQLLSGNTYYSDILIDQSGDWFFNCIANDSFGNVENLTSEKLIAYSDSDLGIYSEDIIFSDNNPIEREPIVINGTVYNFGCVNLNDVVVGFYNGNPDSSGWQIGNNTISIQKLSSLIVNLSWRVEIGPNNIYIFTDSNNSISEINESNNKANKSIDVNSWQVFYGNASLNKILADYSFTNLSLWNDSNFAGNIFITDKEANLNWLSLQAIGRNITNETTNNDFSDIDNLLNMTNFRDSISVIFSNGSGQAKILDNFTIHDRFIQNVPIINSTNNSNFMSGILWDSSKDKGNGEFDISDKEDLVFVSKINRMKQGAFGNYDYEIKVPVKLRDLNMTDRTEIYLYYDLI